MLARVSIPIAAICLALAYWQMAQSAPRMSLHAGFGPGFFPTIIAGFVVILASLELLRVVAKWLRVRTPLFVGPAERAAFGADVLAASLLAVSVTAYALLTPQIGFVPAAAAMLLGLSILMGLQPLWRSALFSIVVAVCLYAIFHEFFGVSFPK